MGSVWGGWRRHWGDAVTRIRRSKSSFLSWPWAKIHFKVVRGLNLKKQFPHDIAAIPLLTLLRVTTTPNAQTANRSFVIVVALLVCLLGWHQLAGFEILAPGKSRIF
jgi:hypothetical protein